MNIESILIGKFLFEQSTSLTLLIEDSTLDSLNLLQSIDNNYSPIRSPHKSPYSLCEYYSNLSYKNVTLFGYDPCRWGDECIQFLRYLKNKSYSVTLYSSCQHPLMIREIANEKLIKKINIFIGKEEDYSLEDINDSLFYISRNFISFNIIWLNGRNKYTPFLVEKYREKNIFIKDN